MRVLQLIDSLNAGGAERIAVNFANALSAQIQYSGIVVTRKEGFLRNNLKNDVSYFFIKKSNSFDLKSILRFRKIIIENKIDIVHSHGTSFFTAFLVKLFYFKIKIVHHEHYGNRANQSFFQNIPLLFCCIFFNKIVVVNNQIEYWFHKKKFSKAIFFPNFAALETVNSESTILKGEAGKRIVCLANLKNPKNHTILLNAFHKSKIKNEGWSLHFVGKNYHNDYYNTILDLSIKLDIQDYLYIYDSKADVKNILSQATIGILCSLSEGFPVTLLEYGLCNLPVIASNVGYCPEIIIDNETGFLFNPSSVEELVVLLQKIINDQNTARKLASNLRQFVLNNFSEEVIIAKLIEIYKKI